MTQTSLDTALRGSRPASASSSDSARARPPGNARHRLPSIRHEHPQGDRLGIQPVLARRTAPATAPAPPRPRSRPGPPPSSRRVPRVPRRTAASAPPGRELPSVAGRISQPSRSRSTVRTTAPSPSHSVAWLARRSSSPSSRRASAGRKAARPGASTRAEPAIVDHAHGAAADRVEQPRHAGPGRQFQRVHLVAVLAAEQHADALQAAQGLQEHLAVAQGQVAALDQADGHLARQQHMLEPQRVRMAAAEQRGAAGIVRAERLQGVAGDLQVAPQRLDLLVLEQFRHDAGEDAPVLQRVGDALRLAGAVRQDAPRAVRAAQHVGGIERQVAVARGCRRACSRGAGRPDCRRPVRAGSGTRP